MRDAAWPVASFPGPGRSATSRGGWRLMQELHFLPAHRLAALVRAREVSAHELLEAHLKQVARHNARLNALITLDEERARARAREADAALARGALWGPL